MVGIGIGVVFEWLSCVVVLIADHGDGLEVTRIGVVLGVVRVGGMVVGLMPLVVVGVVCDVGLVTI